MLSDTQAKVRGLADLPEVQSDSLLQLIALCNADPRPEKIDVGVGVFRDGIGRTPILQVIKDAERILLETQETKSYLGSAGDKRFAELIRPILLGEHADDDRIAGAQTPGGCGALRLGFELIATVNPNARVLVGTPTWPNHPPIIRSVGLQIVEYPYYDRDGCQIRFEAMVDALNDARAGDVVLLHGCCHNPTGANLSLEEWKALTEDFAARGVIPFIDLAYQGFGDGLDADVAGLRHMVAALPESFVGSSCSKNFGLYRDRVGAAFVVAKDAAAARIAEGNLGNLNRLNFSFPPDHGAKVVSIILSDPALRADWQAELEEMRLNMLDLRRQLAEALRRATNSDRFDYIAEHRGMFTQLGGTAEKVEALRKDHGIYMVGTGRINIAGLPRDMDALAKAIAAVGM